MFSTLHVPAGFTVRIDIDPSKKCDLTVTVLRAGEWVGEVTGRTISIEDPGFMEKTVSHFVKLAKRNAELDAEGPKLKLER